MGIITKPKTWVDGEGVLFNDLNNNFDTAYNEINGNLDNTNIKASAGIAGTKLAATLTSKSITSSRWSGLYDNGVSGSSKTIDWANGDRQKIELTANCTLTFSNPLAGQAMGLIVVQDGSGSRTLSYPTSVKWANGEEPTLTTTPAGIDVIILLYDGTNFLAQAAIGFA
jgi:hypothetical protein